MALGPQFDWLLNCLQGRVFQGRVLRFRPGRSLALALLPGSVARRFGQV